MRRRVHPFLAGFAIAGALGLAVYLYQVVFWHEGSTGYRLAATDYGRATHYVTQIEKSDEPISPGARRPGQPQPFTNPEAPGAGGAPIPPPMFPAAGAFVHISPLTTVRQSEK